MNHGSGANLNVGADHSAGMDLGGGSNFCRRANGCSGTDADGWLHHYGTEVADNFGKGGMDVVNLNCRSVGCLEIARDDDCTGLTAREQMHLVRRIKQS